MVEDLGENSDWALVLAAPKQKTGWSEGMALVYGGRYYKLRQVAPPVDVSHWTYYFAVWPQVEIFRHVVDYEQDCAERAARREQSLSSRFSKWLRKKGDGSGSG